MYYDKLDEAKEDATHGKIVGVMYLSSNFTDTSEMRIEKGKDAESEILDLSEIKVWMDMSSK